MNRSSKVNPGYYRELRDGATQSKGPELAWERNGGTRRAVLVAVLVVHTGEVYRYVDLRKRVSLSVHFLFVSDG